MAEYERALENYTTAIGLAPDFAAAYNNRGVIHGRKGAYESAIADYSAAIRLAPDDVTAYENRAIAYARTGAGERARADRLAAARLGEVSLEVEGRPTSPWRAARRMPLRLKRRRTRPPWKSSPIPAPGKSAPIAIPRNSAPTAPPRRSARIPPRCDGRGMREPWR